MLPFLKITGQITPDIPHYRIIIMSILMTSQAGLTYYIYETYYQLIKYEWKKLNINQCNLMHIGNKVL